MAEAKNDPSEIAGDGRKEYERCKSADAENRAESLEDIRFAKLGEQWPSEIKQQRLAENRPVLTINKVLAFIRQVVNDARQNKPSIKVRPADSNGDPETAEVISGLIRNIEYTSNADVAYDTAAECAVTGGIGYIRVGVDYAFDDAFDMDLKIERVLNPFSVIGDPESTSADGSDWNVAFVLDRVSKADFKRKYKGKADVDFEGASWAEVSGDWLDDGGVMIAEWWTREEVDREIVMLSDGRVFGADQLEKDEDLKLALEMGLITVEKTRTTKTHKVTQRIISGLDVLEETEWPGRFIPIVPIYGDEFSVEGKRYYRSLINQAKDAQRMFNYWRTTGTEMVALAPRVPFIGRKGTFSSDADNWATANTNSHAYLEYDTEMPQRQALDTGPAAGALQEALNASDDIKAIVGMYDASLGARSNETSGRAILARQREGDVSTFHFIDNLSRGIRQLGRILIDLIPHYYSGPRIVRTIGIDGKEKTVPVNQQFQKPVEDAMNKETGEAIMAMHDLAAGKYDLTVETGPSFSTRREEAATQMTELVRAFPQAAPYVADIMARNFDWPGADEIAERFAAMNPAKQGQIPPEVQQQIAEGQKKLAEQAAEIQRLKMDQSAEYAKIEADKDVAFARIAADQQIARQKAIISAGIGPAF